MPPETQVPSGDPEKFHSLIQDFVSQVAPGNIRRDPNYVSSFLQQAAAKGRSPQELLQRMYQQAYPDAPAERVQARMQQAFKTYGIPQQYHAMPLAHSQAVTRAVQSAMEPARQAFGLAPANATPEELARVQREQATDQAETAAQNATPLGLLGNVVDQGLRGLHLNGILPTERERKLAEMRAQGMPEGAMAIAEAAHPIELNRQHAETGQALAGIEAKLRRGEMPEGNHTPEQRQEYANRIEGYGTGEAGTFVSAGLKGLASIVSTIQEGLALPFADGRKAPITGQPMGTQLEDVPSYQNAQALKKFMDEWLPENPDHPMASALGSGAGQIAQTLFLGGGLFGTAGKLASTAGKTMAAGSSVANMAVPAAVETWKATQDPEKTWASLLVNAGLGYIDYLPLNGILSSLKKGAGATAFMNANKKFWTARMAGGAAKQGAMESITEGLQEFLSNFTAQQLYDAQRNILDNVGISMLSGGILGGTIGAFGSISRNPNATAHDRAIAQRGEDMAHDALHEAGTAPGEPAGERVKRGIADRLRQETGQTPTDARIREELDSLFGGQQAVPLPDLHQPGTEQPQAQEPTAPTQPTEGEQQVPATAEAVPSPQLPEMAGGMPVPQPAPVPLTFAEKAEAQKAYESAVGELVARALQQHPSLEAGGAKKLVNDHLKELEGTYPSGAYGKAEVDATMQGVDRMREELGLKPKAENAQPVDTSAEPVQETPNREQVETPTAANSPQLEAPPTGAEIAQVQPESPIPPSSGELESASANQSTAPPTEQHEAPMQVVDGLAELQAKKEAGGFIADPQADTVAHEPISGYKQATESLRAFDRVEGSARSKAPMERAFVAASAALPEITSPETLAEAVQFRNALADSSLTAAQQARVSKALERNILAFAKRHAEATESVSELRKTGKAVVAALGESHKAASSAERIYEQRVNKLEEDEMAASERHEAMTADEKARLAEAEKGKAESSTRRELREHREKQAERKRKAEAREGKKAEGQAREVLVQRFSEPADQRHESKEWMADLVSLIQKSMPNIEMVYDGPQMNAALEKAGYDGSALRGAVAAGKIYLNPRLVRADTPVHEAAHVLLKVLQAGDPSLHAKLAGLAKAQPMWETAKRAYPELSDSDLAEEAMAEAIGRIGARMYAEADFHPRPGDNAFVALVKKALQRIARLLGLREPFATYTFEDFATQQAAAILSGRRATDMTSEEFARAYQGVRAQRQTDTQRHKEWKQAHPEQEKETKNALVAEFSNGLHEEAQRQMHKHPALGKHALYLKAFAALDAQQTRNRLQAVVEELRRRHPEIPQDVATRNFAWLQRQAVESIVSEFVAGSARLVGMRKQELQRLKDGYKDAVAELDGLAADQKAGLSPMTTDVGAERRALLSAYRKGRTDIEARMDRDRKELADARGGFRELMKLVGEAGPWAVDANLKAAFQAAIATELKHRTKGTQAAFTEREVNALASMLAGAETRESYAKASAYVERMAERSDERAAFREIEAVRGRLRDKAKASAKKGQPLREAYRLLAVNPKGVGANALPESVSLAAFVGDWLHVADKILKGTYLETSDGQMLDRLVSYATSRAETDSEAKRMRTAEKALADDTLRAVVEQEWQADNEGTLPPLVDEQGNVNAAVADLANEVAEAWQALTLPSEEAKAARKQQREDEQRTELGAEIFRVWPLVADEVDRMAKAATALEGQNGDWAALRDAVESQDELSVPALRAIARGLYGLANGRSERMGAAAKEIGRLRQMRDAEAFDASHSASGKSALDNMVQMDRQSRGGGMVGKDPNASPWIKLAQRGRGLALKTLYGRGDTKASAALLNMPTEAIAHQIDKVAKTQETGPMWERVVMPLHQAAIALHRHTGNVQQAWNATLVKHLAGAKYTESSLKVNLVGALNQREAYDPSRHPSREKHERDARESQRQYAIAMRRSTLSEHAATEVDEAYDRILGLVKAGKLKGRIGTDGDGGTERLLPPDNGKPMEYIAELDASALNPDEKALMDFWAGVNNQYKPAFRHTTEFHHGQEWVDVDNYWHMQAVSGKTASADPMEAMMGDVLKNAHQPFSSRAGASHARSGPGKDTVYDWDGLRVAELNVQNQLFDSLITPVARPALALFNPENKATGLVGKGLSKDGANMYHEWYIAKLKGIRGTSMESSEAWRIAKHIIGTTMYSSVQSGLAAVKNTTDALRVAGELREYTLEAIRVTQEQWASDMPLAKMAATQVLDRLSEPSASLKARASQQAHEATAYGKYLHQRGTARAVGVGVAQNATRDAYGTKYSAYRLKYDFLRLVSKNKYTRAALVRFPNLLGRIGEATGKGLMAGVDQQNKAVLFNGTVIRYYKENLGREVPWSEPSKIDPAAIAEAVRMVQLHIAPEGVVMQPSYLNRVAKLSASGKSLGQKTLSGGESALRDVHNMVFFGFRNQLRNQSLAFQRFAREGIAERDPVKLFQAAMSLKSAVAFMAANEILQWIIRNDDEEEFPLTSADVWKRIAVSTMLEMFTGGLGVAYNFVSAGAETLNEAYQGDEYDNFTQSVTHAPSLAPLIGWNKPGSEEGDERKYGYMDKGKTAAQLLFGPTFWSGKRWVDRALSEEAQDAEVARIQRTMLWLDIAQLSGVQPPFTEEYRKYLNEEKKRAKAAAKAE